MNSKIRIAIIEDERAICEMFKFKFEKAGFLVRTAPDGESGLQLSKEFMPDLILLDLKMPVMPGDEMLVKLRESDWGSAIPVIILTNISKSEAPHALRLLNVERYIVKAHHTPSQVLAMAEEVLQRRA